jgi:hypothetical protein
MVADLGRGICAYFGSSRRQCCGTAVAERCTSIFCLQAAQLLVDGSRTAGLRQLLLPQRGHHRQVYLCVELVKHAHLNIHPSIAVFAMIY